jgi:hypothetical protein
MFTFIKSQRGQRKTHHFCGTFTADGQKKPLFQAISPLTFTFD